MSKRFVVYMAAAMAVIAPSALAAQTYVDPKFQFSVNFPDGWIVTTADPAGGTVGGVLASQRTTCIATASESPETKSTSQADLDRAMREPFGEEFWRSTDLASDPATDLISQSVHAHPSGRPAQQAVASAPKSKADKERMTSKIAVMMTPGVTHVVLCSSPASIFAATQPVIDGVIDSYRPGSPGPLSVSMTRALGRDELASIARAAGSHARAAFEGLRTK